MSPIRVGVIGAGSWAVASHLPNLVRHPDVELVAVARKGPDQLRRVQERFGFPIASEDYRDDTSKMVIQLAKPCTVRYRRRQR